MAIRTRRYRNKFNDRIVNAVQITDTNIVDIVNHITRNSGAATGHVTIPGSKVKKERPGRIRLRQRNFGENWGKLDWRVANVGDWIVRHEYEIDGEKFTEFYRVKAHAFPLDYEVWR